ncbi:transposase [Corallococcus exiguus]|nr:transposase [Corallococcus exiguus]
MLVADKGYNFDLVRRWAGTRHIRDILPCRSDQPLFNAHCRSRFEPALYHQPNIIERAVGHLKDKRAIGTRYDNLAVNYLERVRKIGRGRPALKQA